MDQAKLQGQIVGRVGIEKRPKEADNRSEFGHLEVDTIIGQNHKGADDNVKRQNFLGMLWMGKIDSRNAETVKLKLCQMLDEIRPYIKSITGDMAKNFRSTSSISEYCDFYFANPYNPWERGSNENLNGLVRQYIPKSSDFSNIQQTKSGNTKQTESKT
ncbi:MAG: IS30 family transposase [Flavobacteriaceae bacterium]|nr:IS30 family transposase [Flavobacteriaceae bacterium]